MKQLASPWHSKVSALCWVVIAAAFLIRFFHLFQMSNPELNPAFVVPSGDAGVNHWSARQLLTGVWPGPEPFFRAPCLALLS